MATNPNGNNPETAAARAAQQVADLLRSHLQNLEAQSEAELHEANQERAVADAQFTENESSLREAQEMLRQAQITLDETARDYEQIQQDLQRAEEELRSLTAELEGLIKQEQRLKQDIVAIQATQNNQVQEQEHIAGQLRQTEKEIADITAKMEKLQRELNDAQRKSSTLQREIDQLESLVEDLDQNISEQEQLKSQTQSKLQETEHDMDILREEIKRLKAEENSADIASKVSTIAHAAVGVFSFFVPWVACFTPITTMASRMFNESLSRARSQRQAAEQRLSHLTNDRNRLRNELHRSTASLSSLRQRRSSTNDKLQLTKAKLVESQAREADAELGIEQSRKDHSVLTDRQRDFTAAAQRGALDLEGTRRRLADVQANIQQVRTSKTQIDADVRQLRQENELAKRTHANAREARASAQRDLLEVTAAHVHAQAQRERARQRQQNANERMNYARQTVETNSANLRRTNANPIENTRRRQNLNYQ